MNNNTVVDDALGLTNAPYTPARSANDGIPAVAAYVYLAEKNPPMAIYSCQRVKGKTMDITSYRDILDSLYAKSPNSVLTLTYTGATNEISKKLTFFTANDVNAATGLEVTLGAVLKGDEKADAKRGINYVIPPCTSIAKIHTDSGVSFAPVCQGLINTNYVDYANEVIGDAIGLKKMFAHLTLLTELKNGFFVVRSEVQRVYFAYSGVAVLSDTFDASCQAVCTSLTALCSKYNIDIARESKVGIKYGDFLVKMYDKIVSAAGSNSEYQTIVSAYNSALRATAPNGKPHANRPGATVLEVAAVDEKFAKIKSKTIHYVPVPFHDVARNNKCDAQNADATMAQKVLRDSRDWGGSNNREINVGQRDYLMDAWIGSEAGDVVRLASNLGMYYADKFDFHGNQADLVRMCRALDYKDRCDKINNIGQPKPEEKDEESAKITETDNSVKVRYVIYADSNLIKNSSAYIADGDNYLFKSNLSIEIRPYTMFRKNEDTMSAVSLIFNDTNSGVKSTEVSKYAVKALRDYNLRDSVIFRWTATSEKMNALLEFNKNNGNVYKIHSGVELHDMVLWVSKGVATLPSAASHYQIVDDRSLKGFYRASILINQFRMFNTFWCISIKKYALKYKIKLPALDITAPIGFTTVGAMLNESGVDLNLDEYYPPDVQKAIYAGLSGGIRTMAVQNREDDDYGDGFGDSGAGLEDDEVGWRPSHGGEERDDETI